MSFNPNRSLGLAWILFFRRMDFVWLLMSNSGLLRIKKRRKTPYENQKTASSYLNYILNGLMTDGGGNDNQAQNINIRMYFFTGKSIIVSFYGLTERLKSCKPTSNANDTFPNSLQKSIIDVSSKYHTVLCCFNPNRSLGPS